MDEFLAEIAPESVCCATCGSWADYADAHIDGHCYLCRCEGGN